jgi:Polyprenyl synthetase
MARVIIDFALGEEEQKNSLWDTEFTLERYLKKSYNKTASLMANSCKSAALLSGASVPVQNAVFRYAACLGLAFQIVDDILDFTQSTESLGKPEVCDWTGLLFLRFPLSLSVFYVLKHRSRVMAVTICGSQCRWRMGGEHVSALY